MLYAQHISSAFQELGAELADVFDVHVIFMFLVPCSFMRRRRGSGDMAEWSDDGYMARRLLLSPRTTDHCGGSASKSRPCLDDAMSWCLIHSFHVLHCVILCVHRYHIVWTSWILALATSLLSVSLFFMMYTMLCCRRSYSPSFLGFPCHPLPILRGSCASERQTRFLESTRSQRSGHGALHCRTAEGGEQASSTCMYLSFMCI